MSPCGLALCVAERDSWGQWLNPQQQEASTALPSSEVLDHCERSFRAKAAADNGKDGPGVEKWKGCLSDSWEPSLQYKKLRERSLNRAKTKPYKHRKLIVRSLSFVFQHCYGQNKARVVERRRSTCSCQGRSAASHCPSKLARHFHSQETQRGLCSSFIPSAPSIPACSTQHQEHRQSPVTPTTQATVKVGTAYTGLVEKARLPPGSLLLFPVLGSPPLVSSEVLFLFLLQGPLQMLQLPDKERRHSGPGEGTLSLDFFLSQLGPGEVP